MTPPRKKPWILRSVAIGAALAASAAFASCSVDGPPRPTCEELADAGAVPDLGITPYTQITTDAQAPTALGMEFDYGPQCTDCTQDDSVEVMAIADFEDGFAPAWFNYGEPGIEIEPPQAGQGLGPNGELQGTPPQPWWGLQVATLSARPGGARCGSNYALHMLGGRFGSWGGGYVTRHFIVRGQYMDRFCDGVAPDPARNGIGVAPAFMTTTSVSAAPTGCMFWASPVAMQPSLLGVDVSDFDGVSFWARRGPSGQSTLRIALIDDNTSEDLARNMEREAYLAAVDAGQPIPPPDEAGARCKRIESCCFGCREVTFNQYFPATSTTPAHVEEVTDKRCHVAGERFPHFRFVNGAYQGWNRTIEVSGEDGGVRPCGDVPIEGPLYEACWGDPQTVWNSWNEDSELCCPRTMENEDESEANGDPRYGGKECYRDYVFRTDFSSGSYCWNEGDPPLPEKDENRCGEGFEASVVVGTEWKLYTIPWAELRRFAPHRPPIDPSGIWQVAFYFGAGYLDTYVDDVGFYRQRR